MKKIKILSEKRNISFKRKTKYYKREKNIFSIKCCFLISTAINITMILTIFLLFILGILKIKGFAPSKKEGKFFNNNTTNDKKEFNLATFEKRIKELKRNFIIWPLPLDIIFKPLMSDKDVKVFSSFMKPENIYFEFGSGGSTNLASYYKLKKIYSVESDANWHNKLKSHLLNDLFNNRFKFSRQFR